MARHATLLPRVFRDPKEKAAKETTLIHAMNRLGAVSLFLDLVKGVHARPSVERRGRERRAKRGRQPLPSRAFSHARGHTTL